MSWEAKHLRWLGSLCVRRVVTAVARSHARRLLTELDQQSAERAQFRTLTRLVHQAQGTRFGRDHDFRRIHDVSDFRRLVPVCTPLDLWHVYWSTGGRDLKGLTWPTPATGLAVAGSCGRPVPLTAELWRTYRTAVWTALALTVQARPRDRLLDGQFLFLGDHSTWGSPDSTALGQALDGVAVRELPPLLRRFALAVESNGRHDDPDELDEQAARVGSADVTAVVGEAGRVLRILAAVKRYRGRDDVRDVWPRLTAVLFTRKPTGPERGHLAQELATRSGDAPVLLLEAAVRPEGALAVEDPRYGQLRLLPHHGLFFEFVPVSEMHQPRPTRHGLSDAEVGVPYAVAVTSPAGLWACLTGWTVVFERLDPPLLRVISSAVTRGTNGRADPAAFPYAVQPPHPRPGAESPLSTPVYQRKIS